jgi:opacity protein-like surface antigen
MTAVRALVLTLALIALGTAPAFADVTGFIGANATPENRPVVGLAVGVGFFLGLEFEYASTSADPEFAAPALRTGMMNGLLQTPFSLGGVQPYATIGVGLYRERLGSVVDTGFGLNSGGGLKISLSGPLRLRVDYRVFQLMDARHSPAHRVYGGLNLRF